MLSKNVLEFVRLSLLGATQPGFGHHKGKRVRKTKKESAHYGSEQPNIQQLIIQKKKKKRAEKERKIKGRNKRKKRVREMENREKVERRKEREREKKEKNKAGGGGCKKVTKKET